LVDFSTAAQNNFRAQRIDEGFRRRVHDSPSEAFAARQRNAHALATSASHVSGGFLTA